MDELDAAATMAELSERTLEAIRPFGLRYAASGIIAGSKLATANRFHFAWWPEQFMTRYLSEDLQPIDPIPRWARGTGAPATFLHIMGQLPPKDPGHKVAQIAGEHGCVEGVCVPMRGADGAIGLISLVGDRPPLAPQEFRALVALGAVAFRAAERIDHSAERAQAAPILTLREIELLPYLAHGHSDREIAQLNGISEATVRFHLKNARINTDGAIPTI